MYVHIILRSIHRRYQVLTKEHDLILWSVWRLFAAKLSFPFKAFHLASRELGTLVGGEYLANYTIIP